MAEFAIILPVLLLMLALAIDFGRLFFTYVQVNNAAREGANQGATAPTNHVAIVGAVAREKSSQLQRGESTVVVTETCANAAGGTILCSAASGGTGAGNTITVNVRAPFNFLTPFIGSVLGNTINLNASATATVLAYAAGSGGAAPSTCPGPTAVFTPFITDLTVTLDPTGSLPEAGTCAISGYNYDFGDGNTDVGSTIPITYTYAHPGTYTIELEVTNQGGNATTTRNVTVPPAAPSAPPSSAPSSAPSAPPSAAPSAGCAKPVAQFSWSQTGNSGKVNFTDQSTVTPGCPISSYLWDFGHPTPHEQSNASNPSHDYPKNSGPWTVTLTVTNAGGSSTTTRTVNT
ncbi:MAG TPA: PKD domain-containing protein [Candidatus Limnocylindrales bacterium]|jgi:PKD repeat protein